MDWNDIACIVFTCVTANHMGMIDALEEKIGRKIPILNCVKCSVFWFVLVYSVISSGDVVVSLAVSFLSSYCALWFELIEVYIDKLYIRTYGTITKTSGCEETTTDPSSDVTENPVSDMRKER